MSSFVSLRISSAEWFHEGADWGGVKNIGEFEVMIEKKLDLELIVE